MSYSNYKVCDCYEFPKETIGYADTWNQCREIATERYLDTDGECYVVAYPLNPKTGKYVLCKGKEVTTY